MPAEPRGLALLWLAAFVVAFVLYAASAQRGMQSQDSGWQQYRIVSGQLEHPRGLALSHPIHFYLSRLAIKLWFGEPAFAITLVSAFAAAVAVANVLLTLYVLLARLAPAVIASAALLFAHTFWQHATHTESYALVAALLTGEWLCLTLFATTGRPGALLLVALLNGLGVANHLLALLATPADAAAILWAARTRRALPPLVRNAVLLWLLGLLPYVWFVGSVAYRTGEVTDTLRSAVFGAYKDDVFDWHVGLRALGMSLAFVAYNFPNLTVPLAILGIARRQCLPTLLRRVWLAELLLYALFVLSYSVADQYTFFFPLYGLLALFAGAGLAGVQRWRRRNWRQTLLAAAAVSALWPPLLYIATYQLLSARGWLSQVVRNKPYRDGYRAVFIPWGAGDDAAERLNRDVAALVGDNGLILFPDHMQRFSILYEQAIGRFPAGVELLKLEPPDPPPQVIAERQALLEQYLAVGRPVVLVPYDRDRPDAGVEEAQWSRHGDVYRLESLAPHVGPR